MLHIYDTLNASKLLAMAAAGGLAMTGLAHAQSGCTLDNGYATSLSAYALEMQTCLDAAAPQDEAAVDALLTAINQARADAQLSPLVLKTSLNQAALAHGLDMAERKFVDHVDLEGRDHLYRIRTIDRTQLTGATGANVLLVPADMSSADLFEELQADPQNRANLTRDAFTHIGVGLVERGDRLFVTVLFAEKEGELKRALPVHLNRNQRIRANFTNPLDEAIGWGLTDQISQEQYSRGINPVLAADRVEGVDASGLEIFVSERHARKICPWTDGFCSRLIYPVRAADRAGYLATGIRLILFFEYQAVR